MIKRLLELFSPDTGTPSAERPARSQELAAAVLMLEISLADAEAGRRELDVIRQSLTDRFHLSADEARTLTEVARQEMDHAVSLHEFTTLLKESMDAGQRADLVRLLWDVACADGVIDKYEEYYIRKIADLLYVPHREFMRAKHAAGEGR